MAAPQQPREQYGPALWGQDHEGFHVEYLVWDSLDIWLLVHETHPFDAESYRTCKPLSKPEAAAWYLNALPFMLNPLPAPGRLRDHLSESLYAGEPISSTNSPVELHFNTQAKDGRLRLDTSSRMVQLDEKSPIHVPHSSAFFFFLALAVSEEPLVSRDTLRKQRGCKGDLSKIVRHLPAGLRRLVQSKRGNGSGYWVILPPKPKTKAAMGANGQC